MADADSSASCGDETTEEWRDIPGFPFYQASSQGRIRSCCRCSCRRITRDDRTQWRMLRGCLGNRGYYYITFGPYGRRKKFNKSVHTLVALAFFGICPPGKCINHIDHNRTNNAIGNLEYVTQAQNMRHAWNCGRVPIPPARRGENGTMAKLTQSQADEIRRIYKAEIISLAKLGRLFGVTGKAIGNILRGRTFVGAEPIAIRHRKSGENTSPAKLTNAQATEMRDRYASGGCTFDSLARLYGIDESGIRRIIKRQTYRDAK